jgi:hypothetical protein
MTPSLDADTLLEGYDETRKYLEVVEDRDVPDGATIPRDELVATVSEWGYDSRKVRDSLDLLLERGDFERDGDDVRPVRDVHAEDVETDENPAKEAGPSESEASNPRVDATQDAAQDDGNVSSGACADTDETRVLDAFETAVEFYHKHLDDELPDACDVDAGTAREYFEDLRGWDTETVEEKRLGYAPAGHGHKLLDRLMSEGFTREEILGTGLFYDLGTPHFEGRVVLPYFDRDGLPCYAISRTTGHPEDPKDNQKYTKAVKTKEYSHVDEPIFGLRSVAEADNPDRVLVAGGIADAITLHEAGYPCISPVTTVQFKGDHRDEVVELLDRQDADMYVVNDAERPTVNEVETDGGPESIGEALSITQYGEGLRGAFANAEYFGKKDVKVYLVDLPGGDDNLDKVDPDDFVHDGWASVETVLEAAKPAEQREDFEAWWSRRRVSEKPSERETVETAGSSSALFDLEFNDVSGLREGYRGKNPLGHHGESEDYFVVCYDDSRNLKGYDHKYGVGYYPLPYLLVEAGERRPDNPNGDLTDHEIFVAWKHAKEERLIPDDDPVPYRAMLAVAREHELEDPENIPDTYREDKPLRCYDDVLDTITEEYGLDHGRDRNRSDDAQSDEYERDPRDSDVVLDPRRAWNAAGRVAPEDLDEPLSLETDGDGWRVNGEHVGDVARAVAVEEDLVTSPSEPLTDEYARAYTLAREKYGAPLPEYLTHEDTVTRHDAAFGAVGELSYWHLDEDALNVDVTARDGEVSGDAVRTLDPSPVDGWRESETGESVLVFENGTVWDADLGEDGEVIDALRFVAVDTGIVEDPTAVLKGEEFTEAYDLARTEYGAPLPRWEVGTPETTTVLPPAEELVEDIEDTRREIDKLRDDVEKLYRETVREGGDGVDVLRCLPALGKTTAAIKHAAETPTTYLAPRKELMQDAEKKAEDAGATYAHLPVFSSATINPDVLDAAVEEIRERGKDALRDPWQFYEAVNDADGEVFVEEDEDEITLDRPTCPTAEGEHGDAWALAVHVARALDYTPRDIHERAEAIFGRPLPCQHDGDCEYSEGWDGVAEPETCPDLLIGHYTHGHVESARTYYEGDGDGGVERSARALVVDEFPGSAYAEGFGDEAPDHAVWLARSLRGDVFDRQDLLERDLWGDAWVRAWLSGEVAAVEDERAEKAAEAAEVLRVRADLLNAREDGEEILDAAPDLLKDYDLDEDTRRFVEDPLAFAKSPLLEDDARDPAEYAARIRRAVEEVPAEHGGGGYLSWLEDTVGEALEAAARLDTHVVVVDELPVAGELREFVERADETDNVGLLRSASDALLGGDNGARELSVWASDGYAHRKANLLLEAAVRPTDDDGAARISTEQFGFGADVEEGTTLKHVQVGEKAVVLWDRNHKGAEILTPPSRRAGDGSTCPLVGLDATARRRLWRVALGENVRIRDIHESRAERARCLREVHGLQVVGTSEKARSYEGDPTGKNLDADVALLEEIHDSFSGVRGPRTGGGRTCHRRRPRRDNHEVCARGSRSRRPTRRRRRCVGKLRERERVERTRRHEPRRPPRYAALRRRRSRTFRGVRRRGGDARRIRERARIR